MTEYSKNFNTVWALYQNKLNREHQGFYLIRQDVKEWLANEKEKKSNLIPFSNLISLLETVFEFGDQIMHSIDFIELCSFNLNDEYVQSFKQELRSIQYNLELRTVSEIRKHQQFIELEIIKVKNHIKNTYITKPYREVLMNFSEDEFKDIINKDISYLKNKIKELRYIAPVDETVTNLLKEMIYDISGLEYTQKHINNYYDKKTTINESDLGKHLSIEKALIDKLKQLKELV